MKFLGLLYYIFLYHMMMIAPLAVGDQSHSPGMRVNDIAVRKEEEICGDIDIRNNVSQFSRLENCSVIEGFLQIILIDKGHPRDYENLTFPKLREITEYFLLYRVTGLITLRHIFPNLAVIRGAKLFYNYAFVVYEMISLQEIGLDSLTDILRGSVRIEKNHLLCYVNTINWDLICKNGKGGHFIKSNKGENECPNDCPLNKCQEGEYVKHCWNRVRCHKSCKDCGPESSCIKGSQCCHKECLGGCSVNDSPQNCSVCRNVVYAGRCLDTCNLPGTFQYAGRRCITEKECTALTNLTLDGSGNPTVYWKAFNDMCISECPSGYMEDDNDRYSCKRCNGSCPKVCRGMIVNSVSAAQELYGCTKISGALEIQIQGGDQTVQELEINLGKIEEVEDYVKIFRAYPLVSLNFLRNLRKINGRNQEKDLYSLYVLDNPNLQELWDFTNKTLEITKGKIFFHFNPRLCISKIKELKIKAGLPDWDDNDVSPHSNGDKEGCDSHTLYVNVTALSTSATVEFTNFLHVVNYDMDYRRLLGYVISYREAPEKNVTLYDGRDGCGSDSWMVVHHLSDGNEKISSVVAFIGPLKPFTQYALYIQTYTIATEKKGGHSPIIYFTTHPDIPSTPLDLKGQSLSPNELTLSWLPPNKPNGNITHYIVRVYYQADDKEFLERRNYCSEPILPPVWKKDEVPSEENNIENGKTTNNWVNSTSSEDCCACPKEKTEKEETEFEIQFEDFLHNKVYIKRQRREIKNEIEKTLASNSSTTEKSDRYTDHNLKTEIIVNSTFRDPKYLSDHTTTAVIQDLKHFSDYTIEVIACHDPEMEGNIEKEKRCSSKAITSAKTLPLSGADNIPSTSLNVRVVNETVGDVKVRWEEPLHPNGLIVSYQIEYRRIDIENNNAAPTSTICVTQQNFTRQRYHMLQLMGAGNYSVRVRAVSLAGYGDWTSFFYFNIEQLQDGMRPEVLAAVIASVTILLVFLIIGISLVVFKKRFPNRIPNGIIYASINPDYLNALISECEIAPEKISIIREIGQGSFGMVYEGELKDYVEDEPCIRCAVKTINFTSDIRDPGEILQEAVIMRNFRSHHIVKFLGVVTVTQPVMVVMELMVNGDLKNYLRSHRPDTVENQGQQPPTLKRILQMAIEIADGMAYLSTKKFVHRDLAARNCMVAEDLTVKIGDFGMTRDIYETDYYRKGGRGLLPVRWMAPESLKDGIFTSSSDVWSYGVVLWEMATLASQPYQGLSNEQVLKYIIDGGIMERPENCPEKLYNLMMVCWQSLPKDRPSFLQIIEILLPDATENFHNVSFYHTQLIKPDDEEEQEQQTEEGKAIAASPLQYIDNNTCLLLSEFDKDTEVSLHFSPNRRFLDGEGGGGETERTFSGDCGESSRCLSLNSNEHNKINNHSMNGGLLNGHLHFPVSRDTEC